VVALILGTGIVTDAQTNWPTAKTGAAAVASPVKPRKPARRRRARPRPVVAAPVRETTLLRSMAELITRQAATIDVLTRRLDAAEARLAAVARAVSDVPAGIDAPETPFSAAGSIDWNQVLTP